MEVYQVVIDDLFKGYTIEDVEDYHDPLTCSMNFGLKPQNFSSDWISLKLVLICFNCLGWLNSSELKWRLCFGSENDRWPRLGDVITMKTHPDYPIVMMVNMMGNLDEIGKFLNHIWSSNRLRSGWFSFWTSDRWDFPLQLDSGRVAVDSAIFFVASPYWSWSEQFTFIVEFPSKLVAL